MPWDGEGGARAKKGILGGRKEGEKRRPRVKEAGRKEKKPVHSKMRTRFQEVHQDMRRTDGRKAEGGGEPLPGGHKE
ncbi:hypothetical protein HNY73_021041 [Argiope bruennichi]|uniref:Uncharacterized protein n=1 Tax=Argiope bruennichi TaxID=94029 RepID=A0A8T0EDG5_ARGBR|nr:hypothetical protein HNY73_021041 [Argiope bruennichi]